MIYKIITSRFLSGISFYSFLPFFSLYLLNYKNIPEDKTAIIIFIFLFISRACSLFTPYIIKLLGYKKTLITTYFLASVSISSIYFISSYIFLIFVSAAIGAGFSIANVCASLFMAENNNHSDRIKNFSLLNVIVNISSALGGIVGEWSYNESYSGIIILPSAIMFLSSIYAFTLTEGEISKKDDEHNTTPSSTLKAWYLFVGYSSIPFFMLGLIFRNLAYHFESNYAENIHYISVSHLFALNAAIIIFLQVKVTHYLAKKKSSVQETMYKLSLALISTLLLFFDFKSTMSMYLLIILFTLSELIWSPYNNSLAIEKCPFRNKKISLSICIFCWGLAESLGAYIGIISTPEQLHITIPLITFSILLILFSIEYYLYNRKRNENDNFSRM